MKETEDIYIMIVRHLFRDREGLEKENHLDRKSMDRDCDCHEEDSLRSREKGY